VRHRFSGIYVPLTKQHCLLLRVDKKCSTAVGFLLYDDQYTMQCILELLVV